MLHCQNESEHEFYYPSRSWSDFRFDFIPIDNENKNKQNDSKDV